MNKNFRKPLSINIFLLLFMHLFTANVYATETIEFSNMKFTYEPPAPSVWKRAENTQNESSGNSVYKRNAIKEPKQGASYSAQLSFKYEKTSAEITTLAQFSASKTLKIPHTLIHQRQQANGVMNFYSFKDAKKTYQRFIVMYFWKNSLGLTIIAECPEPIYSSVEVDIERFFASFQLLEVIKPIHNTKGIKE